MRLNMAMMSLGQMRNLGAVQRVLQWLQQHQLANSHTYASAVCAYGGTPCRRAALTLVFPCCVSATLLVTTAIHMNDATSCFRSCSRW